MQAKPLTPNSWLLISDKTKLRIGIAVSRNNQFSIMGNEETFDSLEDIAKSFDEPLEEYNKEVKNYITEVGGYPIKPETEACNLETIDGIPTYTKGESKVRFAAGYYGLNFAKYTRALCPRYRTLKESGYIGPFHSSLEADLEIRKLNNKE